MMKMMNKILIIMGFFFVVSCTDDFNEINEQPDALSTEDVSAKFFVTTVQQQLLRPTMIPLWFGDVIIARSIFWSIIKWMGWIRLDW